MKIRTVYFKVQNMEKARAFWKGLLRIEPHKSSPKWTEFLTENIRLGLLLNDFGDAFSGANCVPVFEFRDEELPSYIERANTLGARVIIDGLNDPNLKSIVCADPFGNEFELSRFHE